MSRIRGKAWVFTINNPNSDDKKNLVKLKKHSQYIQFQMEKGPKTGTNHLQGYFELLNRMSLIPLKKILPRAHLEVRRGTQQEAINYNSKEYTKIGKCIVWGEPYKAGERTDIQSYIDSAKSGLSDFQLMEQFPDQFARYHELADRVRSALPQEMDCVIEELKPWQSILVDEIKHPPHRRKIIVYVDINGGSGKTELTKYLIQNHNAFLGEGKAADIYYAYNKQPIVIFDIPRSKEYISWHAIEAIKNGLFTSTKYKSRMVMFKIPHVILFMNEKPDLSKLSKDRWDIRYLGIDDERIDPRDLYRSVKKGRNNIEDEYVWLLNWYYTLFTDGFKSMSCII